MYVIHSHIMKYDDALSSCT